MRYCDKALFIVRTPFQAWFCERLIERLGIGCYDFLYITHNNSKEDVFYYNSLSSGARNSRYVFVKPALFDVFTNLKLVYRVRGWFSKDRYDCVYMASINSYIINSLACSFHDAELFSFDDGAANLVEDGPYYISDSSFRSWFYNAIFRAQPVEKVRKKISRHYTIYRGFNNIVEEERLSYLDGWAPNRRRNVDYSQVDKSKRYFIGAPFHEVMSKAEIDSMLRLLGDVRIDGYIRHPREIQPLSIDAPIIDKGGRIAEDVIIDCSGGCPVQLYGYLSTVMINLKDYAEKKVVFVSEGSVNSRLSELALESGCEIVYV
ncbi:glycosyltransferase family 52 [Pseudomonadota bacterium 24LQ007]